MSAALSTVKALCEAAMSSRECALPVLEKIGDKDAQGDACIRMVKCVIVVLYGLFVCYEIGRAHV